MGFISNIKKIVNPDVEDDYDDDDIYDDDDGYDIAAPQQAAPKQQASTSSRPVPSMGAFASGSLELKVVKPEKYDSATAEKIANHLLNKRSVVLNLEATNKESARRLIDFLSGVAFSIGGYIQRVATNTFIVVPENVDVSGEQLQEAKKQEEPELF